MSFLITFGLLCCFSAQLASSDLFATRTCEQLRIWTCLEYYNHANSSTIATSTLAPNYFGHDSQEAAAKSLNATLPSLFLCSRESKEFLCALHFPQCPRSRRDHATNTLPGRSLCERVRNDCRTSLSASGLAWPEILACERFPEPKTAPTTYASTNYRQNCTGCKDVYLALFGIAGLGPASAISPTQLLNRIRLPGEESLRKCSAQLADLACSRNETRCAGGEGRAEGERVPCRSSCETVARDCLPFFEMFRVPWPDSANCTLFPETSCRHLFGEGAGSRGANCERIEIPMCTGMAYNYTRLPNVLGHGTQEEAGLDVHQFFPLVKVRCSPDLLNFLCSVYAPPCPDNSSSGAAPPTRELCESAREGCEPVLRQFGLEWPSHLSCDRFPSVPKAQAAPNCESISITMCKEAGYNYTAMPNSLGHQTQEEAALEAHQFLPLVKSRCSSDLLNFLCSVYAPPCPGSSNRDAPPTQELCESSREGCERIMNRFGLEWPSKLSCDKFRVSNDSVAA